MATSTIQSGDAAVYGPVKPPTTTGASVTSTSLVNKDGFVNLVMCVPPEEVEGTASLWRLATQASEIKVHEAAVALLIQIHTHLQDSLKPRLSEFEDLFINSCVDSLQDNLQIIEARTAEQKTASAKAITEADRNIHRVQEKRLARAMRCLKRLI